MAERSDTGGTPVELNPCPICLGPVREAAYLDQCFHKYCYACIWHWMKVVSSKATVKPAELKCPLCKVCYDLRFEISLSDHNPNTQTSNFSVVRESNGAIFDRQYFSDNYSISFFTEAHKYRLHCYYCEPGIADKFNVPRYWKLRKYPQSNRYLHEWIRREIQALIQEEDVEVIVYHVLGVIDSFRRNEERFRGSCPSTPEENRDSFRSAVFEAVERFLAGRSDRFVDEVELFLGSELNIDAYDKVYVEHLGWKVSEICEGNEEENHQHGPPHVVPYLHLFDDNDDNDIVD